MAFSGVTLMGTLAGTATSDRNTVTCSLAAASVGDLVIIVGAVSGNNVAFDAASDSAGNTWQFDRAEPNSLRAANLGLASSVITNAISTASTVSLIHTVTGSFFANRIAHVFKVTGTPASPWLDQVNSAEATTAGTTLSSGNITTTQADTIGIGAAAGVIGGSVTPGGSGTWTEISDNAVSTTLVMNSAFQIWASIQTAVNYNGTTSSTTGRVALIADYLASTGAAAPALLPRRRSVRPQMTRPAGARFAR